VGRAAVVVRRAEARDLPRLGELAGALVRHHHRTDPRRFLLVEGVEDGYGRWLGSELRREGAIVLAAELDGRVVGYGYATLEGRDWGALLDDHGEIHDDGGGGRGAERAACCERSAPSSTPRRRASPTMVSNEPAAPVRLRGLRAQDARMTRHGS
jgi:hypothetical protein